MAGFVPQLLLRKSSHVICPREPEACAARYFALHSCIVIAAGGGAPTVASVANTTAVPMRVCAEYHRIAASPFERRRLEIRHGLILLVSPNGLLSGLTPYLAAEYPAAGAREMRTRSPVVS